MRRRLIYRPPFEAETPLLEVTEGCTWNKCTFCSMYRGQPFRVLPEEEIREQLEEFRRVCPGARRIFLENGDAYALGTDRLLRIGGIIRDYLPDVEIITGYASIRNIMHKSDEELRLLVREGFTEPNIGLESGLDKALETLGKGYTAREAEGQLLRLKEAGMDFSLNVILGSAGADLRMENGAATAEMVSRTEPFLVFKEIPHLAPDAPLYVMREKGEFRECTPLQYLEEEEALLSAIRLPDCIYFGVHYSNIVRLLGRIPKDREVMLAKIRRTMTEYA